MYFIGIHKVLQKRPERPKKHLAQGIALGTSEMPTFALKGQKHITLVGLLPLQGEVDISVLPRAMPWAMGLLPLRGALSGT